MKTLLITWSDKTQTKIDVRQYRFDEANLLLHVQHEDGEWSELSLVEMIDCLEEHKTWTNLKKKLVIN
jgi:hypothetical protein